MALASTGESARALPFRPGRPASGLDRASGGGPTLAGRQHGSAAGAGGTQRRWLKGSWPSRARPAGVPVGYRPDAATALVKVIGPAVRQTRFQVSTHHGVGAPGSGQTGR